MTGVEFLLGKLSMLYPWLVFLELPLQLGLLEMTLCTNLTGNITA